MELPVYQLLIDESEDSQVSVKAIALVDKPAVERNFLAFKSQSTRQQFATVDDSRQIISGLAIAANELIYRKDDQFGEYNIFFAPETVYDIAQKFFALGYNNNFNIMHDPDMTVQGVTIFESFISDESRGIAPIKGFEDVPQGSWFISAKVNNPAVWQAVKDGLVKGFSVEGMFNYKREGEDLDTEELTEEDLQEILNTIK